MSEHDRVVLLKTLADRKKDALKDKKAAIEYLHKIGILTKDGNVSSSYKNLCTAENRA